VSRTAEIAYRCAGCGGEALAGPDGRGRCPACGTTRELPVTASLREELVIDRCPACDGEQLYVQRDFNQKAGIAIIALGSIPALFYGNYWGLVIAAAVDAALYALLPEITVCYRCHAHFRRFARNPKHAPFDLHLAEQYEIRK
jgi:hypothetical protein